MSVPAKPRKRQLKPRTPKPAKAAAIPEPVAERRVTGADLAAHLDLTPARVSQLTSDGTLPRDQDGSYPVDSCRVAYIRFLKQAASVRGKKAEKANDLDEAKLRKMDLDYAVSVGALVPIEDALAVITEAFTTVRNDFSQLGSRVTRDMALRRDLEKEIARCINSARDNLDKLAGTLGQTDATAGEEDL